MPFVPLPTADVCNLASKSSVKIAQSVSRTWYNLDPSLWSRIPQRVTFHADGKGELSSPFTIYSQNGQKTKLMSCKFAWNLAHDGICSGFDVMDEHALYDTIPKLIRSEEAWTRRTWRGGSIPAYLRLDLDGAITLEPDSPIPDPFTPDSPDGMLLPPELLEAIFLMASEENIAAQELTMTCRRSREIVMQRRRRAAFTLLAKRFLTSGIALRVECGHFDPVPNSSKPPISFYCMEARFLKYPIASGYHDLQVDWRLGWNLDRMYYSCKLPLPKQEKPTFWRSLHGDKEYDAHPEVEKFWPEPLEDLSQHIGYLNTPSFASQKRPTDGDAEK